MAAQVAESYQAISSLADRIEGSVHQYTADDLAAPAQLAQIAGVRVDGVREMRTGTLVQDYSDNRCSPSQPSVPGLVHTPDGRLWRVNPLPDTGSVVTFISDTLARAMGLVVTPAPAMGGAFCGVLGKEFRATGLTSMTLQLGYPDKSGLETKALIIELEGVRVVADAEKTFILGTDVMQGTGESKLDVRPWHILLSGQIRIPLRRQDLP